MQIKLMINDVEEEDLIVASLGKTKQKVFLYLILV
jgi:hypothetical protein